MSGDGDEMKALVLDECDDKMKKAVAHVQSEFAALRTGRASSGLVEKLKVEELVTERNGWTVKEFSHAAHDQLKKPGDVTAPVKTSFGIHTIYLIKRIPAVHTPQAEADAKLRAGLLTEFQRRSFLPFIEEAMRRYTIEVHAERLQETQ